MLPKLLRWLLALGLLFVAYKLFTYAITQSVFFALGGLLAMFACIIVATLLFLPESVPFVARPFTALIDGVYGTGQGKGRAPFDCKLARGYVKQGRYEEAVREYRRMMKLYPREAEPYRELVVLHLRDFGDREKATRVFHRGLRKIREGEEEERLELQKTFNDEMLRLASAGSPTREFSFQPGQERGKLPP